MKACQQTITQYFEERQNDKHMMWWVSMFGPKAEAEEQNERLVNSEQTSPGQIRDSLRSLITRYTSSCSQMRSVTLV